MPSTSPRILGDIDAEIRSCCAVRRDAQGELAEVRRRQAELAELESVLLVSIETRLRRVDRLLEERLGVTAEQERSCVGVGVEPGRFSLFG